MSTEENKATVRQFYEEVWNKGNVDLAFEVFAEDYIRHDLRPTKALPGPEGQRKIAADFRAAFPDLEFTVDLILAEGDLVTGRWTARGTNTGSWGGVEPTGKPAQFSGVNIFRFSNGKVAEIWNHRDDLGLREQLGGAPIFAGSSG
jgi:steroid delta-isomerase-like uncharacterized protein